jgi:hypothetical protein
MSAEEAICSKSDSIAGELSEIRFSQADLNRRLQEVECSGPEIRQNRINLTVNDENQFENSENQNGGDHAQPAHGMHSGIRPIVRGLGRGSRLDEYKAGISI